MKQFFCSPARLKRGQVAVFALTAICLLAPAAGRAQSNAVRSVEGKVYEASAPLNSAVVYLQDSKTNNVKSFISTQDGSYRFGQLSSDIDYELWAEYKGKKSDKKTISSFNSKKQLFIDLHIK
ncbi:carboxypeptidase-like regulatory domain-containing protein [Acidobacterium sp. S8]|uniref:carboxypeptidase-like regulatory domain-containing protein n=1 Tax=Acidobacterium sp. S8 TaxID=1641854 RepID=UPI00131E881A|nr:carboxypeptidase-like regulatory domain-containing protein [Acidobacterium sp. S8]